MSSATAQVHPKIYTIYEGLGKVKASLAVPKLQDLHDTRQQQDSWEESQKGSNTNGVSEVRDLEASQ